jgi:hypothetical protein
MMPTRHSVLRSNERWLCRLTGRGLDRAAGSTGELHRVLRAVAECRLPVIGWADEGQVIPRAFPGTDDPYYARYRLKAWAREGLIDRKMTRPAATVQMVTLADGGVRARLEWARAEGRTPSAPVRPPRMDHAIHHLLVISACQRILEERQGRFLRLLGDEDLRSREMLRRNRRSRAAGARRGSAPRSSEGDRTLPDGWLFYAPASGGPPRSVLIEILIGKYTTDLIKEKYEKLPRRTRFFATSPGACLRAEAHRGAHPRPTLLQ